MNNIQNSNNNNKSCSSVVRTLAIVGVHVVLLRVVGNVVGGRPRRSMLPTTRATSHATRTLLHVREVHATRIRVLASRRRGQEVPVVQVVVDGRSVVVTAVVGVTSLLTRCS